jgi:anti-sigma regulatory factor (Ser/Thr protein kinase)
MSTLVARIVLTGTEDEVSPARRAVVEKVRVWGVPLDDETADVIRLVASELITNAVVHGEGSVTVGLYHRPGCVVIDVLDGSPQVPQVSTAGDGDESGRGMALVGFLAARSGREPTARGKRVWAEIVIPEPLPAVHATGLRRFFAAQPGPHTRPTAQPFIVARA